MNTDNIMKTEVSLRTEVDTTSRLFELTVYGTES